MNETTGRSAWTRRVHCAARSQARQHINKCIHEYVRERVEQGCAHGNRSAPATGATDLRYTLLTFILNFIFIPHKNSSFSSQLLNIVQLIYHISVWFIIANSYFYYCSTSSLTASPFDYSCVLLTNVLTIYFIVPSSFFTALKNRTHSKHLMAITVRNRRMYRHQQNVFSFLERPLLRLSYLHPVVLLYFEQRWRSLESWLADCCISTLWLTQARFPPRKLAMHSWLPNTWRNGSTLHNKFWWMPGHWLIPNVNGNALAMLM